MKSPDHSYIAVGKIGSTYGIHGWLKIHSYTQFGASILNYKPWFIAEQARWLPLEVEDGKVQSNTVMAKLTGINTPEAARSYVNKIIYIQRSQLPLLNPNEFYWSDLVGLSVINQQGQSLGKIVYLIETGANDVIVVKGEKEHAIPYLWGKVILSVDLEKQEMQVDWDPL